MIALRTHIRPPHLVLAAALSFPACQDVHAPAEAPQPTDNELVQNRGEGKDQWWDNLPRAAWSAFTKVEQSQDWYEVYELQPGLFAIYEPGQFEEVISYLFVGAEKALLFDTGLGIGNMRQVVAELTDLEPIVVNSHTHYDHVGGNYHFSKVHGTETAYTALNAKGRAHEAVAEFVGEGWIWKPTPAGFSKESYRSEAFEVVETIRDGHVEDITTTLSMMPDLVVTARNSSFVYKGKAQDIRKVGRELGVGHVLEGSIRQAGTRIRVTAQLINTATDSHLWAGTFDGDADDPFVLIDNITPQVLEALAVRLTIGSQARAFHRGEWTPKAYQLCFAGLASYRTFTRRSNADAQEHLAAAIRECPNWSPPHSVMGWSLTDGVRWGWADDPQESFSRAGEFFQRALELDPVSSPTVCGQGYLAMMKRDPDTALDHATQSVALGPSHFDVLQGAAMIANYCGRPDLGLDYAKHAVRRGPLQHSNALTELGHGHILVGEFRKAIQPLRQALAISPFWMSARCLLIWALDAAGDPDGASAEAAALMQRATRFRLTHWAPTQPYSDPADLERQLEALRRAGVPE